LDEAGIKAEGLRTAAVISGRVRFEHDKANVLTRAIGFYQRISLWTVMDAKNKAISRMARGKVTKSFFLNLVVEFATSHLKNDSQCFFPSSPTLLPRGEGR